MRKTLLLGAAILALMSGAQAAASSDDPGKESKDMLLQADTADYNAKTRVVVAKGHVEIDYGGRILMADTVTYNQNTDVVTADGHVSLMDENGNVAFAQHATLTQKMRDGAIRSFAALLGTHGRLVASSAERQGGHVTTAYNVAYTPCKICNKPGQRTPTWQIKAVRVTHDQETHRLKFRDATMAVMGIPVFYSPYLTEPDPTVKHASGFLLPDVGNSTANGYFIRLPYYWSISKSEDATIEPLITTNGGSVLLSEYRQRWDQSGMWLQASVGNNPNGGFSREQSQTYTHLFGSGRFQLSPVWQLGYEAQLTSNETYLKRYDISQLDRLVSSLFVTGEQGQSRLAVAGYFFQGLRASDNNKTFPIPLPALEYTYIPLHKWAGGRFRLDVNGVALSRDVGTNDQRLTAEARWKLPLVSSNGQLWTFQLDARGDIYHTDTPGTGIYYTNTSLVTTKSHYATRGIPYAALDWRWPFIAQSRNGKSIILEPIVQLIAQPYGGNLNNIPNEDTLNVELDENNLLTFDQVPGYDLVVSGPRMNVGMRAESRFETGYVEALLGQTFRLKEDPVLTTIPNSGLTGTRSDLVGRFSVKFPHLDLTNRIDVDEQSGNLKRNEIYLTGSLGRSSTRISYIQLSPTLGLPKREEVNAQVDINFYRNWQGFAAIRRDLKSNQTIEDEFGLGYEDDCLGISLAYRRKYTADRDLPPSDSYLFRFKLKTTEEPIRPFSLFPEDVFSYGRP